LYVFPAHYARRIYQKKAETQVVRPGKINTTGKRIGGAMLGWAITFLIIALLAALLGFTSIAVISVAIAKILFIIFIVLFIISLIFGLRARRWPPLV
jgi:uncharacterized membrane protein YtjA (UPF0391 family)